jgi:predicted ATPase
LPSPLAIEEPEKAIYPGVLELLYYLFDEAACSYQVIISTQSADLLTSFPADSLRVVEKEHGDTKIGPISDHQYKSISENIFSAGALMRAVGLTIRDDSSQE